MRTPLTSYSVVLKAGCRSVKDLRAFRKVLAMAPYRQEYEEKTQQWFQRGGVAIAATLHPLRIRDGTFHGPVLDGVGMQVLFHEAEVMLNATTHSRIARSGR